MESIPSQLSVGRDSNSSPASKQDAQSFSGTSSLKPNQVSETSLYGVPIVSLVIDGQERLCLAQISNTLLKNYSYNEIHNRRVALGITCVQCTPVQLEILRRAGAMPISSRRCGMITKREAERLCKSFLGAHNPPKLPENFAFDVSHECAWGSRGTGGLPLPPYQQSPPKPPTELFGVRQTDLEVSDQSDRCSNTPNDSYHDSERSPSAQSARNDEDKSGDETRSVDGHTSQRKLSYISAFRPVVKDAEAIAKLYGNRDTYSGVRSGYLSPDFVSESSSYRSISPDRDSVDDPDVDVESNRGHEEEDAIQMSTDCQRSSPVLDPSETTFTGGCQYGAI
ncbi:hypothetical protein CRUP_033441 [Coryphaenoides rupestris]|nr:hypothetical protein CRUP_033441 [Coryphaenoides rupestris]